MSVILGDGLLDLTSNSGAIGWHAGTKTYNRYFTAPGPYPHGMNVVTIRKTWSGHGIIRVITNKTYPDGYDYGEYILSGHTRAGYSPGMSINTIHASSVLLVWATIFTPPSENEGWTTLVTLLHSYQRYHFTIEAIGFEEVKSIAEGGTYDMYSSAWNTNNCLYIHDSA